MSAPRLWFTADLHFGHKWMATTHRHFGSVHSHDFTLIDEWNETIGDNDVVYVLGDFSFHAREQTEAIFGQLNGREKYLIVGNHDPKHVLQLPWGGVWDFRKVKWFDENAELRNGEGSIVSKGESRSIYCMHYPMLTWPNAHYGTWHLHGHSHGNLRAPESTRMDVGYDAIGKIAISVEEVAEIMAGRRYDFIDHHE